MSTINFRVGDIVRRVHDLSSPHWAYGGNLVRVWKVKDGYVGVCSPEVEGTQSSTLFLWDVTNFELVERPDNRHHQPGESNMSKTTGGRFCIIRPENKSGYTPLYRNWFNTYEEAEEHAKVHIGKNPGQKPQTYMVVEIVGIVTTGLPRIETMTVSRYETEVGPLVKPVRTNKGYHKQGFGPVDEG